MKQSAGILLYRGRRGVLEVLLAHPGGPLWAHRDEGAWSIPKGEADAGETAEAELLRVARREFREELGMDAPDGLVIPLGTVRLKSGKVVHAWALAGDLDPATATSNTIEIEWPPRSGRHATFPEVDRVAWFGTSEARRRLNPAQAELVDRLVGNLSG